MNEAENKALMRRFYEEFWCKGNAAAVDELVAPDFIDHQLPAGWSEGPAGLKQLVREWRVGFPDMSETIEDLIAQGDKVVGRFVLTGTHQGPFLGIAPTGKRIRVTGIDIVRFQNGRITDLWYNEDTFGLYEQLGVSPDSGESG
jgi:steroid delta-isomerase-like uncharacterized protein